MCCQEPKCPFGNQRCQRTQVAEFTFLSLFWGSISWLSHENHSTKCKGNEKWPKTRFDFCPWISKYQGHTDPPRKDETKRLNIDKHIREEFNVTSPLKCNLLKTSIPRSRHSWESQRGAWSPKCKTHCCRQHKTSVKDTRFVCALNHWT